MTEDSLLGGLRVLDLADDQGVLCGRILADMGADVVKVEPPGGDANRHVGPFRHDQPHPERSLWSAAYDAGKRSITLQPATGDGRALFRRLARSADVVIETSPPGHLDGLGLGYADLERLDPRLILVSITPFGQTGPHAQHHGSDLIALATGGLMYTQGDEDRPPAAFSFPQAGLHAGAEGAAGALFALFERQRSGRGQHVDVSAQEAVTWALMNTAQWWDLVRRKVARSGAIKERPDGVRFRGHWPCRDGYVTFYGTAEWAGLAQWMKHEGIEDPLLERDWRAVAPNSTPQQDVDALEKLAMPFFKARTAQELYDGAVQWRFILYPVFTTAHLSRYTQLLERDFFATVGHDEPGGPYTCPGTFCRTSRAAPGLRGRAPRIGEHNRQVYQGELGLSTDDLGVLKAGGVI